MFSSDRCCAGVVSGGRGGWRSYPQYETRHAHTLGGIQNPPRNSSPGRSTSTCGTRGHSAAHQGGMTLAGGGARALGVRVSVS
eukprot:359831-Chlamydomonas_euryale.AAC.5